MLLLSKAVIARPWALSIKQETAACYYPDLHPFKLLHPMIILTLPLGSAMYNNYLCKACFKSNSCCCLPALNTSPELTIKQNKHVLRAQREGKGGTSEVLFLASMTSFMVTLNFSGIFYHCLYLSSSALICIVFFKKCVLGHGEWLKFKMLVWRCPQISHLFSFLRISFCFPLRVNTAGWIRPAFNATSDSWNRCLSSLL